ncbi:YtxH-like protein [Bacteroidetes bacterium oral taxon 272 str. F0290]|nr:YtxH-like protein [Bacteroidetes bacterium oral taxon 272 str. F0290]
MKRRNHTFTHEPIEAMNTSPIRLERRLILKYSKMKKGDFLLGMVLGTMVGGALGFLSQTREGRKFRRDVKHKLGELQDDVCDYLQRAKDKAVNVKDNVAEKINKQAEAIKEKLNASEEYD